MNSNRDINIERIRDAMAGGVLGAVAAVMILLLSLVGAGLKALTGAEFIAMSGGAFIAWLVVLTLIGAALGYAYGYYATQQDVIERSIRIWMRKNNR